MESLTCSICTEFFDEKERIPKVLKCGHTLCSRCLPNIGGCCPSCRQEVPTTGEEVLTNFFLLSLLGKKETSLHSEKIQNIAEELEKMLLKKKVIETEIGKKMLLKKATETEIEKKMLLKKAIEKEMKNKMLLKEATEKEIEKKMLLKKATEKEMKKKMLLKEATEKEIEKKMLLKKATEKEMKNKMLLKEATEKEIEKKMLSKEATEKEIEKKMLLKEATEKEIEKKTLLKEATEKEIEKKMMEKEAIENEVEKIRQIVSAEGCSSSIRYEDDLKNEEEPKAGALEQKSRQDPNCLLLESFGSTTEFLSHVRRLLLKERKKVFACHRVRGHMKYGEVLYKEELVLTTKDCSDEDLLVMKSLSESQAEEFAAVVRFSDVQKCFTAHDLFVRIVFRHKNGKNDFVFNFRPVESRLLPQLIQLCTGEKGPTYKGAKVSVIQKGWDECEVRLLNYVVDGVPTRGAVDPLSSVGSRRRTHDADVPEEVKTYVEVIEEGQLRIFDGPSNKATEARNNDGVVFYSREFFNCFSFLCSFREGLEDVVVDCGVAIQF